MQSCLLTRIMYLILLEYCFKEKGKHYQCTCPLLHVWSFTFQNTLIQCILKPSITITAQESSLKPCLKPGVHQLVANACKVSRNIAVVHGVDVHMCGVCVCACVCMCVCMCVRVCVVCVCVCVCVYVCMCVCIFVCVCLSQD